MVESHFGKHLLPTGYTVFIVQINKVGVATSWAAREMKCLFAFNDIFALGLSQSLDKSFSGFSD